MSDFNREVRYYVIKIKNLTEAQNAALCDLLSGAQIPCTDCVVVESDWPNYEHTWKTVAQVDSGTFVDPYAEVETLRQKLAESEARVAELELEVVHAKEVCAECLRRVIDCWREDGVSEEHRNVADAYSDFLAELPPSSAWLLRKQAEAVEALAEKIRNDVQGTNTLWKMLTAIDVEAQELRKKAEVAERVGGEKEESDDE